MILLSGLCLIMDLHESSNQMRIWFDDSSNQLSWNPLKLDRQHQYDHLLAGAAPLAPPPGETPPPPLPSLPEASSAPISTTMYSFVSNGR